MFDFVDELLGPTIPLDQQLAVHHCDFEVSGCERAEKVDLFCVLADIDETAAIVEIELVRHVYNCLRVGGSTEIRTTRRDPADDPWLGSESHEIGTFFFRGDGGNSLGNADPEVDYA